VAYARDKVPDWMTQFYAAIALRWSYEADIDQDLINLLTQLSSYPREHALDILRLFLAGNIAGRLEALNAYTPELAKVYPINTLRDQAIRQLYLRMRLYEMNEQAADQSV